MVLVVHTCSVAKQKKDQGFAVAALEVWSNLPLHGRFCTPLTFENPGLNHMLSLAFEGDWSLCFSEKCICLTLAKKVVYALVMWLNDIPKQQFTGMCYFILWWWMQNVFLCRIFGLKARQGLMSLKVEKPGGLVAHHSKEIQRENIQCRLVGPGGLTNEWLLTDRVDPWHTHAHTGFFFFYLETHKCPT